MDCIHDQCKYNVNKHCARNYFRKDFIEVPSYCPDAEEKE